MKLKSGLLFLLFLGCFVTSYATHYRAGEILYELIGPYKYRVTVITYTKTSGISIQADRPAIIITWGDGTTDTVLRSNGPLVGGIPYGDTVLPDVKKNEYTGVHQYPGAPPAPNNFYVLQFFDENRLGGIANLAANQQNGSEGVTFFVDDTLFYYDPNVIGPSSSPVLVNPAVQYANVCDTFYTNPEAVDSNGDSLIYELVPCLADANDVVPQYFFPDQFCNQTGRQECVGANNSCTINRYTGDFVWAEPCEQGFYNVGILIHIYHHGLCIGTMLRDMQIIVRTDINDPPKLTIPDDTCVWAG
ncbi:MAG TPA: hypothetical protein VG603_08400, partial [Chitinophagales bacterium]|nr:hypothetical protein [Chitinophagales bacterium]